MARYSVSELQAFIDVKPEEPLWMGLDVHKKSYYVALLRANGLSMTWATTADPEALLECITTHKIHLAGACYEAGPTGYALERVLSEALIPVIVAAPSKIPRSVTHGVKTDRLDCLKLAKFAQKGLLQSITVPSQKQESERALLRRRFQLTDSIRRSKERIKCQLLFCGIPEPESIKRWKANSFDVLHALELPESYKQVLDSHIRQLDYLMKEKKYVEDQLLYISQQEEHQDHMQWLRSVPGVGFLTAITFELELFDLNRFSRGEELISFLGLAPTVRHSGLSTPKAYLIPVGQRRLRSLLVEASWMWISRDAYAASIYGKMMRNTGIAQKAIVAVARKLAIILWRICIEQRAYTP